MTSPKTAGRLSRLLAMLPWVIANPGSSIDEICERFAYTRSELIKDLELIFVCGLPGYGPGELMDATFDDEEVYVDMADYFASAVRLTPVEALALLASGMALVSSEVAPPQLVSAVEKLQRVLLPDADDVVAVELVAEPALVEVFRKATSGDVVRITYTTLSRGDTTVRDIEPWSVFASMGNWYVSAHCRRAGGERVFRLDRIRAAEPTGESFVPPTEPPEPTVRYTPGEDDVRATLALGPAARWVAEYYPVETVADEGNELIIRFSASDPSIIAKVLLRLGAAARLVDGDEVRAATARLRGSILARYGVTTS